jgi:two-component system, chemotaxis family, CheB/CheR fusion protein
VETKKVLNKQNYSEIKTDIGFPIVGIGASAGGLDPIRKLLETLPIDTGMAFVVIQHLAPGQESMLPEILSRSTQMKVLQVKDGMPIEKNQVYVITPATTMTIKNNHLKLVPKGEALKPINDFMISLSSERKTQAIGIVLSGTGNDGTEGLKAIKIEGGITFVQDPETAQYPDMPKNAINADTAYFILSPEDIVKELVRLAKNPQLMLPTSEVSKKTEGETDLKKILIMLKASTGVDFTHYKETTVNRRIARRRVINKIENNKEYVTFLRTHPNELLELFDDLLIGVTSFFREPKTFEALEEKVFPELVKNRVDNESIRVWVPGCSTGEEVYSVAIALQEFLEEKAKPEIRVQIFGTDANEKNIEKARQGIYPTSIEENISENKLKRFFSRQNGNYQISKLIRDMCIFAKQDITNDPPFSNLDLIMCRNVLIYFDSLLHERVFPIFHYGLKSNGFLVLGESESIGKFNNLFEQVTNKGLIYKKKRAQPQVFSHPETFVPYIFQKKTEKQPEKLNSMVSLKEEVDRLLMAEYVPATLLVSNNLDILFFRGHVNPYLMHESGTASLNVTKMVRKELRTNVQTSVYLARKENKTQKETIQFKSDDVQKTVIIQVKPLKTTDYEEPFFLVTFQEPPIQLYNLSQETETGKIPGERESVKDKQINDLKADLESTKQSLQTIIEVQEATNEELRSTMEEAQSSNEELQSTNEELETAKEELQSGNEELQTLNEELNNRNLALGRLNDDLANLQTNIDLPVVIVDSDLMIRRFTSSAQSYLKISSSDVGQPITKVNIGIQGEDLENTINDSITKLMAVNRQVALSGDRLCEIRIRPYLSEEKKIDGAVLTFTDITARQKVESALRDSELRYRTLFTNMDEAFFLGEPIPDSKGNPVDFRILEANDAFEKQTGLKLTELIGKTIKQALPGIEDSWVQAYCNVALTGEPVHFENYNQDTQRYYEVYSFRPTKGVFASLFTDITERKTIQEKLKEYNENLEKLVEERSSQLRDSERLAAIGTTAGMVGHDIRNPLQAITSDVYLVKMELASTSDGEEKKNALESLKEIEKNVDYINKIVQDLQDFAKPLSPRAEETDLKLVVDELIAKNAWPENLEVSVAVDTEARKIIADSTFINRIMFNLVNNAVQAMPKGGRLTIKAYRDKKKHDSVITVEDTGGGIPESVKNKLFTPMFTTKAKGQGFGLAVIKRMTEALGGTVTFESQEGKGTKFIIRLPPPRAKR